MDASGGVVRHLSSESRGEGEQPPEWPDRVHPMKTLPAEHGMNRFVWDLRYDDPVQIPDAFYAGQPPRGPLVMPGQYTVRLSDGSGTQSAPLSIQADPRDTGSLAGLQQKFALSMQVYRDQDALHRAVNDIRAVRTAVSASGAAADPELLRQAAQIERQLMQVDIKGSEANLNYPGMLNEQIYSFAGLLDDADTAPNAQELEMYAALHARLAQQLAAWSALKGTRVAAFCSRASKAKGVCP
ncbi:MAG TPA: hypothetical protein VKQ31_05740 [Steroidobacteraceae bacterium]|nr:hypothetical protein [Steroidobacteraceae bacterium]